MRGDRRCVC